jgi:hypothetical protein
VNTTLPLPLKVNVWPVLCSLQNTQIVFPLAMTLGKTKPENTEFLQDLVDELLLLFTVV